MLTVFALFLFAGIIGFLIDTESFKLFAIVLCIIFVLLCIAWQFMNNWVGIFNSEFLSIVCLWVVAAILGLSAGNLVRTLLPKRK